jgi:hypothetical protein
LDHRRVEGVEGQCPVVDGGAYVAVGKKHVTRVTQRVAQGVERLC